jgi:putative intracellular protease/amidase
MKLSVLLFDGFTALDVVGGYEVLARMPGMETEFVSAEPGVIAADTRRLGMVTYSDYSSADSTDVLYVPGGPGVVPALNDTALLNYIRRASQAASWTVGICNGVALLGAAGLLSGRTVTTNWSWRERVAQYGATVLPTRHHRDGSLVTGAGVSASIDAALFLAGEIGGEMLAKAIQLGIEYYPAPPFGGVSADEAPEELKAVLRAYEASGAPEALLGQPTPF